MKLKRVEPWLENWVRRSTWTIREAAFVMCGHDPDSSKITVNPQSDHPVSQLYYWLRKERKKCPLHAVVGKGDAARFIPGTLMRRVREAGRKAYRVLDVVWDAYESKSVSPPGPAEGNRRARKYYERAADIIWKEQPGIPISKMAEYLGGLSKPLETKLGYRPFTPKQHDTIRRYLKGRGLPKVGRPPKGNPDTPINWDHVIEKLVSEN